ncbi:hypothetical protein Tco_0117072 [Tanacetum coccineum]
MEENRRKKMKKIKFPLNKSNVRINLEEPQDEPIFDISLEILKNNIIYNALTLTTEVPVIYMQQFWHTVYKNKQSNIYFFHLDYQSFEIGAELIRNALRISPRQPNKEFITPPVQEELVLFIKQLGYADPLTIISQVFMNKLHQPWRTIMSILNKSLTGKALGIDRAKEPITQILWGVVKAENVDFAELLHLLSQHPNLYKRLDSPPHVITDEVRLEKLKYAAKGERKPSFGMLIPESILRGLRRKGVVSKPKKKKDVTPKRSKSITVKDNVLLDHDEALEYAKQVSIDETKKQEKERQTKHKHARIWLEQQVNKMVDEGYEHLKFKLKTNQQRSPEAMLLLNLKKQGKESKKQAILEEIKRKDTSKGLGAPQESPDHSSSSNDSFESATDDKTKSKRDSNHDDSKIDSETRDESDKSNSNEENVESDESDKDFDNAEDYTRYLNDPKDVQMTELLNEPVQTKATIMTVTLILETIHETQEQRLTNLEQQNHTDTIEELVQANVLNEVRNQLPKLLPKVASDALKKTPDPKDHEGEKSKKRRRRGAGEYSFKKNKDQDEPPHFERGNDDEEPRQDDEQFHEDHELVDAEEEPKEHEYKDGFVNYFGSVGFPSRHEVYSNRNIKRVQSIKVDKRYGYAYLEEIVVTRFDEKGIVNQKRVEDVQIGVESYQTKLNLTKPLLMEGCLHQFTPYTILSHPRGLSDIPLGEIVRIIESVRHSRIFTMVGGVFSFVLSVYCFLCLLGQWSNVNLSTIIHVLECFFRASGLRINLHKSKLIGIAVDSSVVHEAANKIGCMATKLPFPYLGINIGDRMSRIKAWDNVIEKVLCRLSKWKMKSLSIGGRLTLLKSVLGSTPLYYMSMYKVPIQVLNKLESIRYHFFNGVEHNVRKMSFVKWKNVLASKEKGGLALFLVEIIPSLQKQGIDLLDYMQRKLGNGEHTRFWEDPWKGGVPLKILFPRIFSLEMDKSISVASKLADSSGCTSLRRIPRGGIEHAQIGSRLIRSWIIYSVLICKIVALDSFEDGEFSVFLLRALLRINTIVLLVL